MTIFYLPDLGEGLTEAEINQWYIQQGDTVEADQPLVAMETAKAVVDVPAPHGGKITQLYGQPGDVIQTGSPLVAFEGEQQGASVAGQIETSDTLMDEEPAKKKTKPSSSSKSSTDPTNIKAAPAVRNLAQKLNVDLTQIRPSGQHGQITATDIRQAAQTTQTSAKTAQSEPLRGVRRAMAQTMTEAHAQVVPVTLNDDVDLNGWFQETADVTGRVIRALVKACQAVPALNVHFDAEQQQRQFFDYVHIGIAMDSEEGLFVPVLKNAEQLNANEIRATINRFKNEVKQRSIAQDELTGSTIQLSNFGTLAGRYANPVVVPPNVAILGIGKIRDDVIAHQGLIGVHPTLPLSLTVDHRVVTGAEAARFLQVVMEDLRSTE